MEMPFYYPWYGTRPERHWKSNNNSPKHSIRNLGLYHSGHRSTLDRHFRWARVVMV